MQVSVKVDQLTGEVFTLNWLAGGVTVYDSSGTSSFTVTTPEPFWNGILITRFSADGLVLDHWPFLQERITPSNGYIFGPGNYDEFSGGDSGGTFALDEYEGSFISTLITEFPYNIPANAGSPNEEPSDINIDFDQVDELQFNYIPGMFKYSYDTRIVCEACGEPVQPPQ